MIREAVHSMSQQIREQDSNAGTYIFKILSLLAARISLAVFCLLYMTKDCSLVETGVCKFKVADSTLALSNLKHVKLVRASATAARASSPVVKLPLTERLQINHISVSRSNFGLACNFDLDTDM